HDVISTGTSYSGSSAGRLVLPSGMTSSRFLLEVFNSQAYIVALPDGLVPRAPHPVIPSKELRALLVKALLWFVDRECLEDVGNSQIVLVGHEEDQLFQRLCPSFTVDRLRAIAEELPDDLKTPRAADDFDAFMFHAGRYLEGTCHGVVFVAVALLALALFYPLVY
ncbi:hypothetical protein TRAPUB_1067, partial [Trametes pubescens]